MCRLVFKITTEIRSTQSTAQLLLVRAEEVLCNIVGAINHGDDLAVLIEACRVTEQVATIALERVG